MGLFWARQLTLSRAPKSAFSSQPSALSSTSCHPERRFCREGPMHFLPPVVREGLISLSHAVYIIFLLDCGALAGSGVQQFIAQLVDHTFFAAGTRVADQPADRERCAPVGIHFHRYLIVRSTPAAPLHSEQRLVILHRLLEWLQGFVSALLLHLREGFVEDALGGAPLTLPHHRVDELRHQIRAIDGISCDGPLCDISFTRHVTF